MLAGKQRINSEDPVGEELVCRNPLLDTSRQLHECQTLRASTVAARKFLRASESVIGNSQEIVDLLADIVPRPALNLDHVAWAVQPSFISEYPTAGPKNRLFGEV